MNTQLAKAYAQWVERSLQQAQSLSLDVYSELEFDLLVDALSEKFGITPEQIRGAEQSEVAFGAGVLKIKFNTKKKTKEEVFAELTLKHPSEKELIEKDIHF